MTKIPRRSREDVAKLGDEIYEREVLPRLSPEDEGKFVLIDVVTGAYEMDRDEVAASDRLLARHPDAQVWMRQAGSRSLRRHRFVATAAVMAIFRNAPAIDPPRFRTDVDAWARQGVLPV